MENKIVTAIFKDSTHTKVSDVWQYDYGQILRIQGLDLPTAVEVDFAVAGASESIARIGTTKDGVTDVVIPDLLIETGKNLVAYIYLRDSASGNTEYQIDMLVTKRAKPEAYDRPEDKELFGHAIEAVNTAADRAEKARQTAQEAAQKAGLDAEQTAQDRVEVAKMVETVTDISEQVKKVEELSNKAQESATQAGTSATAAEKAKAQAETAAGKTAEDRTAVNQAKIDVDEVQKAVRADRAAVEEAKQSVEQLSNAIPESTQVGVQAVNQAKQTAVDEIARTGISHKTAVEGAGTQAVESVENAQQAATEAVESAKTTAVQAVQAEGTTQTGNVTTEGTKQVKAVQDKGNEVLQSIPEDFTTQMETKLNKQQGIENKGKALVIGEDGNVAPGEVQSGGGDGIAIINTMSGESPLVIPDSAERVNKRLELGGKTEQVTTSGAQLFDASKYEGVTKNGVTVTVKDGVITATGTPNINTWIQVFVSRENYQKLFKPENKIYLKTNKSKDCNYDFGIYGAFGSPIIGTIREGNSGRVLPAELPRNDTDFYFFIDTKIGTELKGSIKPIVYHDGDGTWEPYTGGKPSPSLEYEQEVKNAGKWNEGTQKYEVDVKVTNAEQNWSKEQTLTLTSDRPITKWDRLVEQGGQIGWLYNTDKYIVTGQESFETKPSYVMEETVDFAFMNNKQSGIRKAADNFCNRLTYVDSVWSKHDVGFGISGVEVHIRLPLEAIDASSSDESAVIKTKFSEYLKKKYDGGGPFVFYHKSKTTEFIPIPQSEQNAIRALKTYYPTTVITTDGGELDPDIKVTYTADTKNYIDNKVSAKVASIIRQYRLNTANLLSLMPMETQAAMIENDTNNILENAEEMKHE